MILPCIVEISIQNESFFIVQLLMSIYITEPFSCVSHNTVLYFKSDTTCYPSDLYCGLGSQVSLFFFLIGTTFTLFPSSRIIPSLFLHVFMILRLILLYYSTPLGSSDSLYYWLDPFITFYFISLIPPKLYGICDSMFQVGDRVFVPSEIF